jgi:hypothetical protein
LTSTFCPSELAFVAQRLERGGAGHRCSGRLFESQVRRFRRNRPADGDVFAEGAVTATENLVADLRLRDVLPDCLDDAGEVRADQPGLRPSPSGLRPREVGSAGEHVPVERVDGRRFHAHEDTVVRELGLFHLAQLQHAGIAVTVVDDCLHGAPFGIQCKFTA